MKALILSLLLVSPALAEDCKSPELGRQWHEQHGQTIRLAALVPGENLWLWINPETGFTTYIEEVSKDLWCWRGDATPKASRPAWDIYPQQLK